jgi:hypothetical protein
MEEKDKFRRITDEDDPERCQGNDAHGQCKMKRIEGSKYCIRHGGYAVAGQKKKAELRNLKLTKFKARLVELGNSSDLMSLRDEIAILRITLEETVNQCEGEADLLMYTPQIAQLVKNIGDLVKNCHSIESKTGHLLSKDVLSHFAGQVIDIIVKHVADEDARRAIAGEIVEAVQNVNERGEQDT